MAKHVWIAILLVCFYDALIQLLIPSSATFFLVGDGMAAYMVSTLTALAVGGIVVYSTGFKKCPNIWILLLFILYPFSAYHSPNIQFESAFMPKDPGVFNYKPMFEAMAYFTLFMGVLSMDLNTLSLSKIFRSFALAGCLYSAYIILQHLGMDQFYKLQDNTYNQLSRNPQDGGFISQPVYASALLSICLPFIYEYRKWLVVLPIAAILLTTNRSALAAIGISGLYLILGNKKIALWAVFAYVLALGTALAIFWFHPAFNFHIEPYGRLAAWKQVLQDIVSPIFPGIGKSYVLTGLGPGSFSVLFPFYHHSSFYQAHNEYLEILYCLSGGGLFLFLKAQWHVFKASENKTITAALLAIFVFAITNPVWHIPQLQFLTAFLVGLAYNKSRGDKNVEFKSPLRC